MIEFIKPGHLGSIRYFNQLFVTPIQNGSKQHADEYDKSYMNERSYVLFKLLEPIVHASFSIYIFYVYALF